eukprot:2840629-Pyramimonas_sp.AAC.1
MLISWFARAIAVFHVSVIAAVVKEEYEEDEEDGGGGEGQDGRGAHHRNKIYALERKDLKQQDRPMVAQGPTQMVGP